MRTRYRLGEQGQWLLDPLLYLEYNRKVDLEKTHKLEARLILAKIFSKFNLALNPIYEVFFVPGVEHELGLDVGFCWEVRPRFSIGLESTSRFEFEHGETISKSCLGPTVSLAAGRLWHTVGSAWGLTDDSDSAGIRFLMGMAF